MGFFVPGGPAAWNGRPQDMTAAGHVAVACRSGSIADAFLSARRAHRAALRRVLRGRRPSPTPRTSSPSSRRIDRRGRSGCFLETVRRPEAFVDALRQCAEAESRSSASRSAAPERRLVQRSRTRVRSSAPSARSRRCSDATQRSRSTTSTSSSRRSRSSAGVAGHVDHASPGSRSRAESAHCSQTRPRLPEFRSSRSPTSSRRALGGVPELPRTRNPLDAWGIADETEVYPRSLRAARRVGRVRRPRCPGRPLAVPRPDERRVVRADASHPGAPRRGSTTASSPR